MRLEDYVQEKTSQVAGEVTADAPMDTCPTCGCYSGQLIYDKTNFTYECTCCGEHWSSELLEIDRTGKITMLELAD
ncbi:MAG TPA: hypothetical protein VKQ72_14495 [Aggregatilineales bacterium]|nr:hypothetical protein [Aggregatilineales bacterium]